MKKQHPIKVLNKKMENMSIKKLLLYYVLISLFLVVGILVTILCLIPIFTVSGNILFDFFRRLFSYIFGSV